MNLDFVMPTRVLLGRRCVLSKGLCLKGIGQKALIVTGASGAVKSGALDDVTQILSSLSIEWTIFNEVVENPPLSLCYRGLDSYREAGCDCIIAIGGGSTMDVGKVIAVLAKQSIEQKSFFRTDYTDDAAPLAVVSTVAGSGAEVSPYVALVDERRNRKRTRRNAVFMPKFAFLDPTYSESVSTPQLIEMALDTLAHAVEGVYTAKPSPIAHALSLSVIRTIVPQLKRMQRGDHVDRELLLCTSMQAGLVLALAGTGLLHELGYPLTYHKGVSHGMANGMLLPGYVRMMQAQTASLTNDILVAGGWNDPDDIADWMDELIPSRVQPSEEEFLLYANHAMKLEYVTRYKVVPSIEEVIDVYRDTF